MTSLRLYLVYGVFVSAIIIAPTVSTGIIVSNIPYAISMIINDVIVLLGCIVCYSITKFEGEKEGGSTGLLLYLLFMIVATLLNCFIFVDTMQKHCFGFHPCALNLAMIGIGSTSALVMGVMIASFSHFYKYNEQPRDYKHKYYVIIFVYLFCFNILHLILDMAGFVDSSFGYLSAILNAVAIGFRTQTCAIILLLLIRIINGEARHDGPKPKLDFHNKAHPRSKQQIGGIILGSLSGLLVCLFYGVYSFTNDYENLQISFVVTEIGSILLALGLFVAVEVEGESSLNWETLVNFCFLIFIIIGYILDTISNDIDWATSIIKISSHLVKFGIQSYLLSHEHIKVKDGFQYNVTWISIGYFIMVDITYVSLSIFGEWNTHVPQDSMIYALVAASNLDFHMHAGLFWYWIWWAAYQQKMENENQNGYQAL